MAVTGANGQLGDALVEALSHNGDTPVALTRAQLELEEDTVEDVIASMRVDWIVHCAAYTAVDRAEEEPERAQAINANASAALARGATRLGAKVLYISTDYVFDGTGRTPYGEDAETNPLNVYGRSKLAGEMAVAEAHQHALIVRASWLMGGRAPNFAKTMMRLGKTQRELSVVCDQVGRPTWVFDLAPALIDLMERGASGVLHVANQGQASWHEVAERLFVEARDQGQHLGDLELHETTTERYGARARRPRYSVLDLNRCHKTYGVTLPDWRDGLTRAVESYA